MKKRKVQDAFVRRLVKDTNADKRTTIMGTPVYQFILDGIKNKTIKIVKTKRKYITTVNLTDHHRSNLGMEQFRMVVSYMDNNKYGIEIRVTERWIQNLTKEETAALMIHKIKGDIKWEDCP